MGDQQEDEVDYHPRIQEDLRYLGNVLLGHEINSGKAARTYLERSQRLGGGAGMGGGSFTTSCRSVIGQGKGVARGLEDVWNKYRGGQRDHQQAG
jgi:hypothetical protein